ncbi:MAG: alcohol dehydrogenase catalytic domain-containing protein, partial [Bacteroidota bacterium]
MVNNKALAMVFQQVNKPFKAHHLPIPSLNAGEVLVKTTYATICTSDLHTYYGRRPGAAPS